MCRRGGRGGGLQARCSLYGFVHGGCMADTPRHLHSTVVQHRLCTVHLGRRKGWTMPACDSTSLLHHRHAARITATAINHATILISKPSQCTWRHGRQQQCAVCLAISSILAHTHTHTHTATPTKAKPSIRNARAEARGHTLGTHGHLILTSATAYGTAHKPTQSPWGTRLLFPASAARPSSSLVS